MIGKRILFAMVTAVILFNTSCGIDVDTKVGIELPIQEIEALLDKASETADNLIGNARIQMSKMIEDVNNAVRDRLDQIKSMGKDMWKLMYGDLSQELKELKKFVMDYTKQLNEIAKERIDQIDTVLKNRIDQLDKVLTNQLNKIDEIIQKTIKSIEESTIKVIKQGEDSIITIMDNGAVNVVRTVIIILLVVIFIIIAVLAWKGTYPKKPPQIIVSAIMLAIVVGICITFLVSNDLMAHFFIKRIRVDTEVIQKEGYNPSVMLPEKDGQSTDPVITGRRGVYNG